MLMFKVMNNFWIGAGNGIGQDANLSLLLDPPLKPPSSSPLGIFAL